MCIYVCVHYTGTRRYTHECVTRLTHSYHAPAGQNHCRHQLQVIMNVSSACTNLTLMSSPATVSAFTGSSTSLTMGHSSNSTTLTATTLNLNAPTVSTNATTLTLLATPTTVNAFGGSTALSLGASTGTTTINNALIMKAPLSGGWGPNLHSYSIAPFLKQFLYYQTEVLHNCLRFTLLNLDVKSRLLFHTLPS